MKNLLKKYLRDGKEGFSLVELIIVIAIMAILVGVVSLAVIPYLEKSKESKDLQTLSTVSTALTSAVASAKSSGEGEFEWKGTATDAADSTDTVKKVRKDMFETLAAKGTGSSLECAAASGAKVYCYFNTATNTIKVYAAAAIDATNHAGVQTKYNDKLEVSN